MQSIAEAAAAWRAHDFLAHELAKAEPPRDAPLPTHAHMVAACTGIGASAGAGSHDARAITEALLAKTRADSSVPADVHAWAAAAWMPRVAHAAAHGRALEAADARGVPAAALAWAGFAPAGRAWAPPGDVSRVGALLVLRHAAAPRSPFRPEIPIPTPVRPGTIHEPYQACKPASDAPEALRRAALQNLLTAELNLVDVPLGVDRSKTYIAFLWRLARWLRRPRLGALHVPPSVAPIIEAYADASAGGLVDFYSETNRIQIADDTDLVALESDGNYLVDALIVHGVTALPDNAARMEVANAIADAVVVALPAQPNVRAQFSTAIDVDERTHTALNRVFDDAPLVSADDARRAAVIIVTLVVDSGDMARADAASPNLEAVLFADPRGVELWDCAIQRIQVMRFMIATDRFVTDMIRAANRRSEEAMRDWTVRLEVANIAIAALDADMDHAGAAAQIGPNADAVGAALRTLGFVVFDSGSVVVDRARLPRHLLAAVRGHYAYGRQYVAADDVYVPSMRDVAANPENAGANERLLHYHDAVWSFLPEALLADVPRGDNALRVALPARRGAA
jgi:hypothetical protein